MPAAASTDWLVTSDFVVAEVAVGQAVHAAAGGTTRMSILLAVPGCGMQLRDVGEQGKIVS